ncbi:MAG: DUF2058 domain-containing protein [Rhodanobacteraceae bacterium]|nr:DUF2058 domain-containing protein [Rhodanobacteraceae bacterium]
MRNLLQDQLLKAGLVKKQQVDATVRAQTRQRDGKAPATPPAEKIDAQKLAAEKAERDRALAAERNAQLRARELEAQVRQLIEHHKIKTSGEIPYRFVDGGKIRSLLVDEKIRAQLAKGTLVIARDGDSYALLPRASAEAVASRGGVIALDHGRPEPQTTPANSTDDDYYAKFKVPDDLIW